MKLSLAGALVAASSSLLFGCDAHDHSLGEEACEHLSEGPFEQVAAGADADSPVDAGSEHASVALTLNAVDGASVGYIAFSAEGGDHAFYFDAPVEIELTDAGDAVMPILTSGESDVDCAAIKQWYTASLPVGIYVARIEADAATTSVNLVRMAVNGAHDH